MPPPTSAQDGYKNMNNEYDHDDNAKFSDDNNASIDNQKQNPTTTLSLPKNKSSILGASSNLVNSIVGAGIIGIPYALRMSGLISGVFLLLLVSVLTDKSLRLLIEQASFHPKLKHRSVHTYEELARSVVCIFVRCLLCSENSSQLFLYGKLSLWQIWKWLRVVQHVYHGIWRNGGLSSHH
jgi:hypothetical protein